MHRVAILAAITLATIGVPAAAIAQDYPSGPVRIIVPHLAGSSNDTLARVIAEHLKANFGQPVLVENRPGAGSQSGTDGVAKSKPDGYIMGAATSEGVTMLPAVKRTVPYKVPDDFSFIARVAELPFVLAVAPKLGIRSVAELVAQAKSSPGKLRYGTLGVGSATHLAGALIARTAGVEMIHVPFASGSAVVNGLLTDSVDVALVAPLTIRPYTDAGTIRAIATTGSERHPLFAGVPTLQEAEVAAVVAVWHGVLAPAGLPEPIVTRWQKALADTLNDPKVVKRLTSLGFRVSFAPGEAFRQSVVKDLERWKSVADSAAIAVTE